MIREIDRVSKPGRRVYASVKSICRASTTASASRSCRRRRACMADHDARDARMSAAKSSARCSERTRKDRSHVSYRQESRSPIPPGRHRHVDGQTVKVKGPKGELAARARTTTSRSRSDKRRDRGRAARRDQARARHVGHCRARWSPTWSPGVTKGFEQHARDHRRRLSRGGAGQEPAARARLQPRRRLSDPGRHRRSRRRSRPRS